MKLLAFDIETDTSHPEGGLSFNAPIVSIAAAGPDFEWVNVGRGKERELLMSFVEMVRSVDPVILAGFNSGEFDLRRLTFRANIHAIVLALGRDNSEPIIVPLPDRPPKHPLENTPHAFDGHIAGRPHWDLWFTVDADPALRLAREKGALASYSLKHVAPFLGYEGMILPPEQGERNALHKLSDDELAAYNLSDARATLYLTEYYLHQKKAVPIG